ncbi:MAG: hypothetical protein RL701_3976, partial [Pseudomonadota bacterium]
MQKDLLRRTMSRLARGVDRAFTGTALNPPKSTRAARADPSHHSDRLRTLRLIASFYGREDFLTQENLLLPRPAPIAPEFRRVRSSAGPQGEVIDLTWPSTFEPLWARHAVHTHIESLPDAERKILGRFDHSYGLDRSADLRDKYMRAVANRTAHARWFRHSGGPRPCVVLLHGYMAGNYLIEERVWQVKRLFNSGLDVVLTVLPLHGARRSEERGYRPPAFPSSDPRFKIEGFRQVVFDHRALFDYLRGVGVTQLGVMGMSLGGYAAALLSTLEKQLLFSVLFVPLAAVEDFAHSNGHMAGSVSEQLAQREALCRAQRVISPFARASLVPSERMVVVAGEEDLVTGVEHARKL